MSLLYPLYALAALGIAAPILFHFFQRKPKGKRQFSSLLFLQPTPPRITTRSRLSDLLLLLCRALILALIAVAFARPFVRSVKFLDVETSARSVVLVVDTSASMQREGVWQKTQDKLAEVIQELSEDDQVALVSFDRLPETQMGFDAWASANSGSRLAWLREQVQALQPTWHRTDLASALAYASDLLLEQADDGEKQSGKSLQIVLCSDLQEGSDLAGLQAYAWPSEVDLQLVPITADNRTNASLQWLPAAEEEQDGEKIRVLVRNESDSQVGELELDWQDGSTEKLSTNVPPGQTRVVKLKQPSGTFRLTLTGDEQPFDNQAFFPAVELVEQELWYLGSAEVARDRESLLYYLQRSPLDTRHRRVAIQVVDQTTAVATANPKIVPLIVVEDPSIPASEDLKRYLEAGGRVLMVVPEDASQQTAAKSHIQNLWETEGVGIENVESGDDYAMLAEVDFQNPLLQPFADPRYNDFSRIRFWSHRVLKADVDWRVVAAFDDGAPALIEKTFGSGVLWLLTSGWQPSESQLAVSTKFVPLLHGFFEQPGVALSDVRNYVVGDPIPVRAIEGQTVVVDPRGEKHSLEALVNAFRATDVPGMYSIEQPGQSYQVAVNLAKEESRTDPMLPGRLEQLGVSVGQQQQVELTETEQRQMRNKELEGRQKFWRWGVLGALGLLAGETWLSRSRTDASRSRTDAGSPKSDAS